MDWINCNTCCRQPGDEKERMFMLSSCGHIFCDLCLSQAESRNKCKVCSAQCQLIQLSSKMKPETEAFFQEPGALLKKQSSQMSRLLEFQKEHRIRLVSFHRKMMVKYKEMERKYRMTVERLQQLEKENMKLKEVVNHGAGGGGEFGAVGNGTSPHNSYQMAIIASKRNSPQGSPLHHVAPGAARFSPGRLTLLKGKSASVHNRTSPILSPNENKTKSKQLSPHMQGRAPVYQTHLTPNPQFNTGTPTYSVSSDTSRNISPLGSRTTSIGSFHHSQVLAPSHSQPMMPPSHMVPQQHFQGKKLPHPDQQPYPLRQSNTPLVSLQNLTLASPRNLNMMNLHQSNMMYPKF